VKLIQRQEDAFLFDIGKREKRLLLEVLNLYPLIPAAHHRLSKATDASRLSDNQRFLEEALGERKQQNKRQLLAMLSDERRIKDTDSGCRLTLDSSQIEWLLQVVNDIRVGSWLILGEPDERNGKRIELNNQNARYYAAMEFCGYFQMALLDAFGPPP